MWYVMPREPLATSRPASTRPAPGSRFAVDGVHLRPTPFGTLAIHGPTGGWAYLTEREATCLQALSSRTLPEAARAMAALSAVRPNGEIGRLAEALWQRGILSADGCRALDPMAQQEEIDALSRRTFSLILLLSSACNLDCSYCYLGLASREPAEPLSAQVGRDVLEQALGRPERLVVDFGEIGGSRAIFRELARFIRQRARELNRDPKLLIQTNGTLLREEDADFLAEKGFSAGVSIDGPRALNDAARRCHGGAGTYDRIVRGLELLSSRGVHHWLYTTIGRHNVGHVQDVVDEILALGGGHYVFTPVLRLGEARDRWNRIGIDADEYAAFLRQAIRRAIRRSAPLDSTRHRFLHRVLGSPDGWRTACTSRRCGCGRQFLVVEGNGRRAPCPKFAGAGAGSERIPDRTRDCALPTDPPSDAAAPMGELPAACRACPWQRFCGGGCALAGAQDPMCAAYRATFEAIFEEILPAVAGPGSAAPGGAFEIRRLEFGEAGSR